MRSSRSSILWGRRRTAASQAVPIKRPAPSRAVTRSGDTARCRINCCAATIRRPASEFNWCCRCAIAWRTQDAIRDQLIVRQAQVRRQQLEDEIRLEVADAQESVRQAFSAYQAAVEARKLQEQSVSVEQQTFQVGRSTNLAVIQYEGYLAQARSTEVASKGAYAKSLIPPACNGRCVGCVSRRHGRGLQRRGGAGAGRCPPREERNEIDARNSCASGSWVHGIDERDQRVRISKHQSGPATTGGGAADSEQGDLVAGPHRTLPRCAGGADSLRRHLSR